MTRPAAVRLTRRQTLASLAAVALAGCQGTPLVPPVPPSPPRPPGPLTADEAAWLERLSWGANDSGAREVQRQGLVAWREQQLRAAAWPPRLPAEAQAHIDGLTISQFGLVDLARRMEAQREAADALADADQRRQAQQAWRAEMGRLERESATRTLLRALYSTHQLQSQLGWFWLNHFSVHGQKGNIRVVIADYDDRLQALALGRFRDLLGAVVFHPAMLRFLDNEQNAVNRVNENLGRELLELHTLGVDGGYTQADVQALTRVLTGLGINHRPDVPRLQNLPSARAALYLRRGLAEFHPGRHDFGPKTLLGQPVQGEGVAEIDGVLDRLARHPSTARHVSRKLARFMGVEEPSAALVERLAQRFLASDGRTDQVLRELFATPEFAASLGRRFKDPMHWVLSAVRQGFDGRVIASAGPLMSWLQRLGEPLYGRQTPDGYALEASAWQAPGQMTTRFEVARSIAYGTNGLYGEDAALRPPGAASAPPAPAPAGLPPPGVLQGALFRETLAPRLSAATRDALAQQAGNPREATALWFSSPEFMQH